MEEIKTPTSEPTRQCLVMSLTTSRPPSVNRPPPSIPQPCDRSARASTVADSSQMDQQARELEDSFEEKSVNSHRVTSSINFEREVHTQRAFLRAPPAVSQVANRQRGTQLLRALTVPYALPGGACEISLQFIDLTQGWSDAAIEPFCLRRPPDHGGSRLHLHQTALYSRTKVPSCITSTSRGFCCATRVRASRRPSTSRRTGRSPRILLATATWPQTGRPCALGVGGQLPGTVHLTAATTKRPTTPAKGRHPSLVLLPSSPIDWQQPTLTRAHSVSPQQPAKSAWQPRLFLIFPIAGSSKSLCNDARGLLNRLHRESQACPAVPLQQHLCCCPLF